MPKNASITSKSNITTQNSSVGKRLQDWLDFYTQVAVRVRSGERLPMIDRKWLSRERRALETGNRLHRTEMQIQLLAEIGVVPQEHPYIERLWRSRYDEYKAFVQENDRPPGRSTERALYNWRRTQQQRLSIGYFDEEHTELLRKVGIMVDDKG